MRYVLVNELLIIYEVCALVVDAKKLAHVRGIKLTCARRGVKNILKGLFMRVRLGKQEVIRRGLLQLVSFHGSSSLLGTWGLGFE